MTYYNPRNPVVLWLLIVLILGIMGTVIRVPRSIESRQEHVRTTLQRLKLSNKTYDIIFILDRSSGVGRNNFYFMQKSIVYNLIRQHVRVDFSHTRIALITFGSSVTTEFNYISTSTTQRLHKCELMEHDKQWEKIRYRRDRADRDGTNINGAMDEALNILERGRGRRTQSSHSQLIIIMTDLEWIESETPPSDLSSQLRTIDIDLLLVGVGRNLMTERVDDFLGVFGGYAFSEVSDWEDILKPSSTNSLHHITGK